MKRILPLTFALLLSFSLNAQTSLTEAVNFKSTAHGGEEIDLFEILDNGQYVLLDFFFSTCGPCKEYAPRIVEAYYRLGSNQKDVYIMEISPSDNYKPYSTDAWINMFDIPYPTIHTKTGGDTGDSIYAWYKIKACPTLVLIAPDHKILLQDYKPASADSLVELLSSKYGVETFEVEGIEEHSASLNIYPNPVNDELFLATEMNVEEVSVYDIYGRMTKVYSLQTTDVVHSIDVAELNPGIYFINIKTDKGVVIKRFIKS